MKQEYYELVDDIAGKNELRYAVENYKKVRNKIIIITIILFFLCIGIMYLRFRIIGR